MHNPAAAPYRRVKQYLLGEMEQGRWPPGAQMPSEAELVAQFGVSRMTVNRALRELQGEGLVERVQGVGTFAAQLNRVSSTLTINDIQEEIHKRGHRHDATVHLKRAEAALPTAQEAKLLGIQRTDPCLIVVRGTVSRGVPVTLARLVHPGSRYTLESAFRP